MIVKFFNRGTGGGSGPVDYLLGQDRDRDLARLLRGDPDMTRDIIDSSKYAKKYTSGVLSLSEDNISEEAKQEIMSSFERALLPGLDADQYDILWVEHRDKQGLELNFVVPNVELQSGKRLQPYYDPADRDRVNAWRDVMNHDYALSSPLEPERRRLISMGSPDLPSTAKEIKEALTNGLVELAKSGHITNRKQIIDTIKEHGFEIARTTKKGISIKGPSGGRNIRLSGALFDESLEFGAGLRAQVREAQHSYEQDLKKSVQIARIKLEACLESKSGYHRARYNRTAELSPEGPERTKQSSLEIDPDVRAGHDLRSSLDSVSTGTWSSLNDRSRNDVIESVAKACEGAERAIRSHANSTEQLRAHVQRSNGQQRAITSRGAATKQALRGASAAVASSGSTVKATYATLEEYIKDVERGMHQGWGSPGI